MPFENLNAVHFTAAEKTATATNLDALENDLIYHIIKKSETIKKKYQIIN